MPAAALRKCTALPAWARHISTRLPPSFPLSFQGRLEAGREAAGLAGLEPQCFSNEEQTLAQARLWQEQAAERAAAQLAAARQHAAEDEAAHLRDSWGGDGAGEGPGAEAAERPTPADLAAAEEWVQRHMPPADAAALVEAWAQHLPRLLLDWDRGRADAAVAWLHGALGCQLAPADVARHAPLLLQQEAAQLERAMRFAQPEAPPPALGGAYALPPGQAPYSSLSVVDSIRRLLVLRAASAAADADDEQQQLQAAGADG